MVLSDGWIRQGSGEEGVHSCWRNRDEGLELRVARFEDGTWDVVLNSRMMANRDSPEEAVERARELMEELVD